MSFWLIWFTITVVTLAFVLAVNLTLARYPALALLVYLWYLVAVVVSATVVAKVTG